MPQSRDSIADVWGPRTPFRGPGRWPLRVDEQTSEKPDQWVQSACVLCATGCGLDIGVKNGRIVGVRGRAEDRINRGRLGPKGLNGWQANNAGDRLTRPLVRTRGKLRETTWDEAMALVALRFKESMQKFTADSVGFYNTGQLFLEEYYTLSMITHAGVGTTQLDGNTRLCTATASEALRETFGSDGQPASFADLDVTDCLFLVGCNMAETLTVMWARVLDRRAGPKPPKLIVVDPRETPTAKEADVHLAAKVGTNVALLNGILHLLIRNDSIDRKFIAEHTDGFGRLEATVANYAPKRVRQITGVPEGKLREAAEIIGNTPSLVSACLQGVYQSNQATAAACQVNNINVVLGKIGRPGSGVFQLNGQPTSENTRETGCDGEFPFFLNWQNPQHVQRWADLWNVDVLKLPHWHLHAHAMELFRHAETGSLKVLWIIGTNPAVSLPELHRIRKVLGKKDLFLIVNDAYRTETAEFADVVLPAALWGEKTGTFTNTDRTVHLSLKAVNPPGEARSDFAILLDFARRMDFRDKDGKPLIKWRNPEGAFNHFARCSKGWRVDYSGLTYEKLGGSGIPWPVTDEFPDGCERLYEDFRFHTGTDECQTYGHDVETGAARTPDEYRANDPAGKALLKAANYIPPTEQPDDEYPFSLTTGRVVYHFHTRTKTGRCPALQKADPGPFVQIARGDARRLGIKDGDLIEVSSRRGTVRAPARLGGIEPGHVFIPFHFGYWDADPEKDGYVRAANELTITAWDPVSKQPYFKFAAVQVRKVGAPVGLGEEITDGLSKAYDRAKELTDKLLDGTHRPRVHLPDAIGLLRNALAQFARASRDLKKVHFEEPELVSGCEALAALADEASAVLDPFARQYGEARAKEPTRLRDALFPSARTGAFGVLRDLQALKVLATEVYETNTMVSQAAQGLRDAGLMEACGIVNEHVRRQEAWLHTQVLHRSAHAVVVPN